MSRFTNFFRPIIASTALAFSMSVASAMDPGDPIKGEKVFKKCMNCHEVGDDASNGTGPALTAVVGRVAGAYDGYKFGKHIVEAGEAGLVWTEEELFEYLKDPRKYLRAKLDNSKAKSKMSFKLKKEKDRANVIAYLKTFSPEEEGVEDGETATDGEAVAEETTTTE